tara:strand:- start:2178 stop:2708 length:531 start_codon:yes stop_codon:yes gene_type:complete
MAKELLSKQEFVTMVQWINARWNNNLYTNNANVKRYWDDYKHFSPDTVWEALNDLFDAGLKFAPTPSEWKRQCTIVSQAHAGEYERREREDIKGELPYGGEAKMSNRDGLNKYLDGMGYESFWHAVYETNRKKLENGTLEKYQDPKMFEQPWEKAKEWFLDGKRGSLAGVNLTKKE